MKRNNQKRGFTIVELVIVIAVIAILAAVLIPTYANLVKKANEAAALSDAKNLVTEMLANILSGGDDAADLVIVTKKGDEAYIHGYDASESKVVAYINNPVQLGDGATFADKARNICENLVKASALTNFTGEMADWRKSDTLNGESGTVATLGFKREEMAVFADYDIAAGFTGGAGTGFNVNVTKTVDSTKATTFTVNRAEAALTAPAGSLADGEYTFKLTPKSSSVVKVGNNEVYYSYDIKLLDKDGNVVTANAGTTFTVEIGVGEDLSNVKVYHEGSLISSSYQSSGKVTFNTASFSTFDITFDAPVASVNGKNYFSLSSAVYGAKSGDTITVLRDFTSDGAKMNNSSLKLTLDLNGHTITFNENKFIRLYMGELTVTGKGTMQEAVSNYSPIVVDHKASNPAVVTIDKDVTLKGWSGILVNPKSQYSGNDYALVINVYGTLTGVNDASGSVGAGLYVNGANISVNPAIKVNIYESAVLTGTGHGIYGAGYAEYTTSGTITGGHTGIELRAGKLNVTGGTITGNGVPTEVESNGNGATTIGAGIAVAQHTTKLPTELTVTGGTIKGYTALHQSNPQNNDEDSIAKVKLAVSGGTFTTINGGSNAVYSENCTGFITGGTFNGNVDAKYKA